MLDRALSQLFEYAIDSLPAIRTWMASVVDFVHFRFNGKLYDSGVDSQHWSLAQLTGVSMDVVYLDGIGR